ncbi:GTP cyclohydrolase II [Streptomyces sp. NBC_01314]|uniref:GTP cyclohydrolase II n=1 Tax=Streptomyces sp. NBC_01314 TaxID=2903821 RepID=UPI00308F64E5|nr:GTP cyclohydrolase II [Streptomyces sp. NBC_01314]
MVKLNTAGNANRPQEVRSGTQSVQIRQRIDLPQWSSNGAAEPHLYSFDSLSDGAEHVAVHWPGPDGSVPLVRLHSECLTGDVLGSARCDCGPQLSEAIEMIRKEGGVLLYLRQEGRGIGLYNKIDAYALQEQGLDTVDANLSLDMPVDARRYDAAAEMLCTLGITRIRLLTNNPDKVQGLTTCGIEVAERVPTTSFVGSNNYDYLRTKAVRLGHEIDMVESDKEGFSNFSPSPSP